MITATRSPVALCAHAPGHVNRNAARTSAHKKSLVKTTTSRGTAVRAIAEPQPVEKVTGDLATKCIRSLQFLAVDATNAAASGHPGAPMALAPAAYVLFNEYMHFNPKNPGLFNRDRFVLSNGHASMLQYGILHLCGSDTFTVDQLKQLRQWGSVTPGHPERQVADGIEVTTGPLGQGIANAVGLAVAEAHLSARFNKADAPKVFDNYTYAFLGDGCMMEGISQEACSLAGHWGLGKLIAFYDDNGISIDGKTDITFTEDTGKRFEALGWHVLTVEDGNTDLDGIRRAIEQGQAETERPTLIRLATTIGYGSPNMAGTPGVHGAPLGADEGQATRDKLNWAFGEWEIPDEVYVAMRDNKVEQGKQMQEKRKEDLAKYRESYSKEADEIDLIEKGGLPTGWEDALRDITFEAGDGDATRKHSHQILNKIAETVPTFLGGSADLASSNKTYMDDQGDFTKSSPTGRNIAFGVREHGMAAICNGIAAYAPGIVPFASTFTIFTDYMRAGMRLSALSNNRVLYVTTHDCIGLGGDGPTHQSIEQLAGFRAMPNMPVIRPCGGSETVGAYEVALRRSEGPTLLALSRQKMSELPGCDPKAVAKGAYIVDDSKGEPSHILIGTGSELPLCVDAAKTLRDEGANVRVVSMPCMELFEEQDAQYKESVLPKACRKRVTVEALSPFGWGKYATDDGVSLGMTTFGASADGDVMFEKFGFTADNIAAAARKL